MTTKKPVAPAVVPVAETSIAVRTPEVIAAEIRFIDNQARQYVLQSAIEIGNKLDEAKALVKHGEWGEWLKVNVNYSQSTANNFMRVSKEYVNSQALANLNYSQAVALLSVPADEREAFAEEVNASDKSTRELQAAIKAREEAERQLAQERKLVEEQKASFDAWAAKKAEETKELEDRHKLSGELREAAEKQVAELESELEKAKAGGDNKEIAKAKTELRKAEKAKQEQEKRVAELTKQLDTIKAEVEKEAVERLQKREQELTEQSNQDKKDLQDRLDKLEKQLKRSNNEAFLRAKLQIQQLISIGDLLVKAIAEVKEQEEQGNLKSTAAKVVEQLRQQF